MEYWPIELLAHWTIIKWNIGPLNDYKMNIGPLNLYRMRNCHNDPLLRGIFAILTFIKWDIGPLNILIWFDGIWFYIENVYGISSILYCIVFCVALCIWELTLPSAQFTPHILLIIEGQPSSLKVLSQCTYVTPWHVKLR